MFLSRLILNPRSREVRRDLGDCQELHRTLLSAFPRVEGVGSEEGGARERFGLLHRVEFDRRLRVFVVLVQSKVEPNWSSLPEDYTLAPGTGGVAGVSCKPVTEAFGSIGAGVRLRFRLRANPTRRVSGHSRGEKSGGHGKRVELRGEERQLEWLRRKGEAHGFRLTSARVADVESEAEGLTGPVPNVRVVPEAKSRGWRRRDASDSEGGRVRRLTFGSTLFEGELIVEDAVAFRRALEEGIGSAKAYGFGLLSVARASV